MRTFVTVCLLLLVAVPVWAQPSVSSVSGTLTHGSSITIGGSSFGTKSTAAPLKYDDFQSVTAGNDITTSSASGPAWTNNPGQTYDPVASTALLRSGTPYAKNMLSHHEPSGAGAASSIRLTGQTFVKFYLDAWMYFDTTSQSSPTQNIKPFRIHNTGAGSPNAYVNFYDPGSGLVGCGRDGVTHGDSDWSSSSTNAVLDTWIHWQWLINAGSGNNAADGDCILYINGSRVFNGIDVATTGSGQTSWPEIYIGNYIRSGDWSGDTYTYWEALYIDSAWARVELSNNATYLSATHREIQIPSAWSSTSITATLNRGSFGASDNVYLHVCDDANSCSSGYAVTLGSGGSLTSPVRLRISGAVAWAFVGFLPAVHRHFRRRLGPRPSDVITGAPE